MRKLFRIGMYFFILNLLFRSSQTKEIESTQTLNINKKVVNIVVDDKPLNQSQIENFKKAIDFGRLNNVEVKVTINGGK